MRTLNTAFRLTRRDLLLGTLGSAALAACGAIDDEGKRAPEDRQWPFVPVASLEATDEEAGHSLLAVVVRRYGAVSGVTFRPIYDEAPDGTRAPVVSGGRTVSGLLVTRIAQFGGPRGFEIQRRRDDGSWITVTLAWHLQATVPGWYRLGYSEEPLSSHADEELFPEDQEKIDAAVAWGNAHAA